MGRGNQEERGDDEGIEVRPGAPGQATRGSREDWVA